ncbi:hypothetical protein COCCADRAFT_27668 [Bipolaris zeicola 26-R-13]|uniref:SMB domain-containing protein n=1 Tax=Cochliobolus carbonum (strain 26-R-13) TaxID=930089 RepID=W6Y8I3_COCC2|nr:uncharacterized protein COCCADRAFT_27668 [Bipolaris zeicola 26-R-13]EUC31659.1 hypothetical protein COCCADRAFT_27668 [Bipolaris zeicola 26-R-13]
MQFLTTIALTLALAFSPSAIAAPNAIANTDLLPRDISSMPNGMKSLLTRDATADSMTLEKRATCVSACLSGCGFCGSQGCLANCQINCSICCAIHNGCCEKDHTLVYTREVGEIDKCRSFEYTNAIFNYAIIKLL